MLLTTNVFYVMYLVTFFKDTVMVDSPTIGKSDRRAWAAFQQVWVSWMVRSRADNVVRRLSYCYEINVCHAPSVSTIMYKSALTNFFSPVERKQVYNPSLHVFYQWTVTNMTGPTKIISTYIIDLLQCASFDITNDQLRYRFPAELQNVVVGAYCIRICIRTARPCNAWIILHGYNIAVIIEMHFRVIWRRVCGLFFRWYKFGLTYTKRFL